MTDAPPELAHLSGLLEALAHDSDRSFAGFANAVLEIDEAAQPRLRRLLREHVRERMGEATGYGNQVRNANATRVAREPGSLVPHFLGLDIAALSALLEAPARGARGVSVLKPLLGPIAMRIIRGAGQLVRWQAMHYGTADALPWRRAAFAYALAERNGLAHVSIRPWPRIAVESTIAGEFARLAAFAASGPASLPIAHIEALDRLIGVLLPRFAIGTEPVTGAHYWIDLDHARAPARHARPLVPRAGLRFVRGLDILPELDAMETAALDDPDLPASLGLEGLCDAHDLLAVIAHLRTHWTAKLPVRRHPHRAIRSGVLVVRGFDDVLDTLVASEAAGAGRVAVPARSTEWTTGNASAGGFAATVAPERAAGLVVGEMLAVQTVGRDDWRVGIVRRLERIETGDLFVAVELLQGEVRAIEIAITTGNRTTPIGASNGATSNSGHRDARDAPDAPPEVAIIASDGDTASEAFLAVRTGVHVAGNRYLPEHLYRGMALVPEGMARRGTDHVLLRCRLVAG